MCQAYYISSHTEELLYNKIFSLWMTMYIYIYIYIYTLVPFVVSWLVSKEMETVTQVQILDNPFAFHIPLIPLEIFFYLTILPACMVK